MKTMNRIEFNFIGNAQNDFLTKQRLRKSGALVLTNFETNQVEIYSQQRKLNVQEFNGKFYFIAGNDCKEITEMEYRNYLNQIKK